MEILGFIFLLGVGLYLFAAGGISIAIVSGFSGKFSWAGAIMSCIGAYLVYLAGVYAPFEVIIK